MRIRHVILCLLAAASASAQSPAVSPAQPLPIDPKVIVGALPNGLKYYIRKNSRPEKRAELRLVVNAGSILEDDDQRGLAHFIEHIAFNATPHSKQHYLTSHPQSSPLRSPP